MPELLLGIDGGGSKTRAVLADRAGSVLGTGTAASSNYQSVGIAAATQSLQSAVEEALTNAGLDASSTVAAACFGLAGVDRPADRALWETQLAQMQIVQRFVVVNDAELVLAAGTSNGWGVALICGTGSIAYGRAADGRTARAGGWGYLLGDEGSGYAIALQALRLATQTADGRAEAHTVLAAVLGYWNLNAPSELIGYVYCPAVTRADIARLAHPIMDLAHAGDVHARDMLDHAACDLARLICAVLHRLDLETAPLAFGGGLLGASPWLQAAVIDHVTKPLEPGTYVDDPARGALVLARKLLE